MFAHPVSHVIEVFVVLGWSGLSPVGLLGQVLGEFLEDAGGVIERPV